MTLCAQCSHRVFRLIHPGGAKDVHHGKCCRRGEGVEVAGIEIYLVSEVSKRAAGHPAQRVVAGIDEAGHHLGAKDALPPMAADRAW